MTFLQIFARLYLVSVIVWLTVAFFHPKIKTKMNIAQPYSSGASLDLTISLKQKHKADTYEFNKIKYFGTERDYKKSKKLLFWFSFLSTAVFIATGILVF